MVSFNNRNRHKAINVRIGNNRHSVSFKIKIFRSFSSCRDFFTRLAPLSFRVKNRFISSFFPKKTIVYTLALYIHDKNGSEIGFKNGEKVNIGDAHAVKIPARKSRDGGEKKKNGQTER